MPVYYVQDVYNKNQMRALDKTITRSKQSVEKQVKRALTELGGLSPSAEDLGGGAP